MSSATPQALAADVSSADRGPRTADRPDLQATFETPACDLCGAREQRVLFPARDLRHKNPGEFAVVECERCQLRYLSPRPTREAIASWYPKRYSAHSRTPSRWRRFGEYLEDKIWNAYLRVFLTSSYPVFYYPRHAGGARAAGPRAAPARHRLWQRRQAALHPRALAVADVRCRLQPAGSRERERTRRRRRAPDHR